MVVERKEGCGCLASVTTSAASLVGAGVALEAAATMVTLVAVNHADGAEGTMRRRSVGGPCGYLICCRPTAVISEAVVRQRESHRRVFH